MAYPTQKVGTLLPQIQRTEYDFDPERGYITRTHYEGVSRTQMLALQQSYVAQGIACRLIYPNTGDIAQLEVEDSTKANPLDTWGIDPDDENLDVFLSPKPVAALEAVYGAGTDAYSKAIGALFRSLAIEDDAVHAFKNTELAAIAASAYGPLMKRLYAAYQAGTKEFKNDGDGSGYVLRHTTNAPNRWADNIADFGVGYIYTTAQLLSEVQSGTLWNFPCPARIAYKIANLRQPVTRANYQVGWFKCRSTEASAANNRINITQKYIFGQWFLDLYDAY